MRLFCATRAIEYGRFPASQWLSPRLLAVGMVGMG